ncbi:hypothetical protein [Phytoactinopolyspora endophytica]|uniref:hypothetical protein n=1 Tax=Phytoactinopolyspora endophytica TaxID=1642495 RepID=UPI00101DF4E1|nr:hypothetical protein [Phytoactinopolyspora endophytica]
MTRLYLTLTTRLRPQLTGLARRLRREDGYSTEAVLATALLTALALAVLGTILYNAVVDKANSIDLG